MAQRGDYDYLLLREKKLQVFCQLQRAQRSTYLDRSKKKTWAIDDRVRRIFSYFYNNRVVYSKVPIRHTFPIRNTVLNKCIGGDFHEFYSVKFCTYRQDFMKIY